MSDHADVYEPDDDDDIYSTKPDEPTDEDLLVELAEEEARENAKREAALREVEKLKAAGKFRPEMGNQLSEFQLQIISTGSGVGKALLIVLVIAFIVKSIELCINYVKKKMALSQIRTAISKTKSKSVAEYNENSTSEKDRLTYVKYNAEFTVGAEMDEKIRQQCSDKTLLLRLLNQRAIELLKRRTLIMRKDAGITRAYRMDMLPGEVWSDFQAAKENLGREWKKTQYLSQRFGIPFNKLLEGAGRVLRQQQAGTRGKVQKKVAMMRQQRQPKKPAAKKKAGSSQGGSQQGSQGGSQGGSQASTASASPGVPSGNAEAPPMSKEEHRKMLQAKLRRRFPKGGRRR